MKRYHSSGAVAAEVTVELAAQLQRTVLSLENTLKKIKQAESVLNKTDAVSTRALTYSTHKSVRFLSIFLFTLLCCARTLYALFLSGKVMSCMFLILNLQYIHYTGTIGERSSNFGLAKSSF